jgi:hypothetical protein
MLKRRVWAFLHPRQIVTLKEVEWLAQEIRYLLSQSNADVLNAHLTQRERQERIDRNGKMLATLDRLLT